MSIINAYDESEEIVKPEIFVGKAMKLPEIAIVGFKKELIDEVEKNPDFEEYSSTPACGDVIKIYKTSVNNKDIILYKTLMGGPATASIMEELHCRGVKKFIFFGSCGELTSNLKKGAFIIPTSAYRDEGTSYHYIPSSDFIEVETYKKLAMIFDKHNIKYELTKTWTTDALYKETVNKTKDRIALGCKVVEMECASIMAVAKARNIDMYQFLYTDDTLDGNAWNLRTLREDRTIMIKECLRIALEVAKKI